jgi:uncharacterized Zn-binding protein involved in type VI secretion
MPATTRIGDSCSGHSCYPPRPNVEGSGNVFVNNISVHRQDDAWHPHCCDGSCHSSETASGSSSVYVNGKQMARIGDPVKCGSVIAQGSGNVFCGN